MAPYSTTITAHYDTDDDDEFVHHEDELLLKPRSSSCLSSLCSNTSLLKNSDDDSMIISHWKGSSFDPYLIWSQDHYVNEEEEEIILISSTEDECDEQDNDYSSMSAACSHDDDDDDDDMWSTLPLSGGESFGVATAMAVVNLNDEDDENDFGHPQYEAATLLEEEILGRTFEMPAIVDLNDNDDDDDADTCTTCSSISMSSFSSTVSSTSSSSLFKGTFEDDACAQDEKEEPVRIKLASQPPPVSFPNMPASDDNSLAATVVEAEIQAALAQLRLLRQEETEQSARIVKRRTLSRNRRADMHNNFKFDAVMMNYRLMSFLFGAMMLCSSVVG